MRRKATQLAWLEFSFGHDLDVGDVRAFLSNVIADQHVGRLIFETESSRTGVTWRIGTTNPQQLRRLAKTHLPDVAVTTSERRIERPLRSWRLTARAESLLVAPDDLEAAAAGVLGALAVSGPAVTIHQIAIGPRLTPERVPQPVRRVHGTSWLEQFGTAALVGSQPIDGERRRDLTTKRSMPGAVVTVRLGIHDPDDDYRMLPGGYVAAWRSIGARGIRFKLRPARPNGLVDAAGPRLFGNRDLRLNVDELLAVLGWPFGERSYPRVDRDRSIHLRITRTARDGRLLGIGTDRGQEPVELRLSADDSLRHTVITGPTGVGKSTLLATMALADIADSRTVVVIDPKADLVDDLLARIPGQHLRRVVVLDPASAGHVVGFNPLDVGPSEVHQAVDGLVHVFKTLHANSWGPRSEDILHASLLTLGAAGGASLIDLPRLWTDRSFRQSVLGKAAEAGGQPGPLRAFWSWFDNLGPPERSHVCAPLMNKLRPFTLRPSLATMLSSPQPFRLERIFTERLILLVPLRKGRIGSEAAQLFGSLLVSELWRTILTRASVSRERRHPSFVYADEFQDYIALPTDFADVLAQSRGLGVGWTLAHQNFDQLPGQLHRAVSANAQNKVYFRLGPDDAARVAKTTDQLRPQDLIRLPAFEAYAQVLRHHELMPFASIRTEPLSDSIRDPRRAAAELLRRWGASPAPDLVHKPSDESGPHAGSPDDLSPSSGTRAGSVGRRQRGAK